MEYNELKKQYKQLQAQIEQEQQHPTSEYDESIAKQNYFNETLKAQVLRSSLICIKKKFKIQN